MELNNVKIIKVLPLQSGIAKTTGKEWKKRSFVVETQDSQYPIKLCLSAFNALASLPIKEGYDVNVQFSVESREYQEKWYTEAKAFNIIIHTISSNDEMENNDNSFPPENIPTIDDNDFKPSTSTDNLPF